MTVVNVRAFVDESATHNCPTDPMILTCVASTILRWQRFDKKWAALTKRAGVKHIHAHDFDDIPGERRLRVAEDIDKAIDQYMTFGFHTILWPRDFAAYRDSAGSNLHTLLDSDYGLSFRFVLSFLHAVTERLIEGKANVYVLYELGHKNCGAAPIIFEQYAKDFPDGLIKSVAPVRKGDYYGTEAADIRGSLVLEVEREGKPEVSKFDPTSDADFAKLPSEHSVPWFRVAVRSDMLAALKDNIIVSKPKFTRLYGHLHSASSKVESS